MFLDCATRTIVICSVLTQSANCSHQLHCIGMLASASNMTICGHNAELEQMVGVKNVQRMQLRRDGLWSYWTQAWICKLQIVHVVNQVLIILWKIYLSEKIMFVNRHIYVYFFEDLWHSSKPILFFLKIPLQLMCLQINLQVLISGSSFGYASVTLQAI